MRREVFSSHLISLTPDIKRMISSIKRKRFFGMYSDEDLLQEVLMRLWVKIPKLYKKEKGDLKKYCMAAAFNLIKRLANNEYEKTKNINVDWYWEFEHNTKDAKKFQKLPKDLHEQLISCVTRNSEKEEVLFSLKLDKFAELDKDFVLVKMLYDNNYDRKKVQKLLKKSNAYITKALNRIRDKYYSEDFKETALEKVLQIV